MYTDLQRKIANKYKVHAFVIKYLEDMGIKGERAVESHLFPLLADLPSPFEMKNMREIDEVIIEFIVNSREILIWGDYDVDGITGSAVLFNFIREVGGRPKCFIPNRLKDGYGLSKSGLDRLAKGQNPAETLLITVDCGISNAKEIAYAQNLGYTVIVTDHHQIIDESFPKNCLVLNGEQAGCSFGSHKLAGVGTVFFLIASIRSVLNEKGYFAESLPNLKKYLDLVAIGTVADLVPLTAVNRILVKAGFEVLASGSTSCPGIKTLLEVLELEKGVSTAEEVAFKISPAINAAGRMGKAELAFGLLTEQNQQECQKLADQLIKLNKLRKKICKEDLDKALEMLSRNLIAQENIIIIFGGFHNGTVGITASQLTEIYGCPAIVFSEEEGGEDGLKILKGSCRSVDGINIFKAISYGADLAISYGGHRGAAGISIRKGDFEKFKGIMLGVIQQGLAKCTKNGQVKQYVLPMDEVFQSLFLDSLKTLEPTGEILPKPLFIQNKVSLVQDKLVGSGGEHLQLVFRGTRRNYRGIGFRQGRQFADIRQAQTYSVKYTPYLNRFNKRESWQVLVSKIEPEPDSA